MLLGECDDVCCVSRGVTSDCPSLSELQRIHSFACTCMCAVVPQVGKVQGTMMSGHRVWLRLGLGPVLFT